MALIEKEQVLRINCPGFGESSFFSSGCARPLNQYSAIVVNPISILHLFDKDPDLLKQIEAAQLEGLTSYTCKSDKILQSVKPDLDHRINELVAFIDRGGLLIYYLCPPFLVQGGSLTLDNYYWLDVLAPDKSQDKNRRNISAAARGKNVEASAEGQASHFAVYLKQPAIEWTTLIRTEKLAEAYTVLATAGPNKCIAGKLDHGGGQIVFLPAPYNPDFDIRLMESINLWYGAQDRMVSPPPSSQLPEPEVYTAVSEPVPTSALAEPETESPAAPEPVADSEFKFEEHEFKFEEPEFKFDDHIKETQYLEPGVSAEFEQSETASEPPFVPESKTEDEWSVSAPAKDEEDQPVQAVSGQADVAMPLKAEVQSPEIFEPPAESQPQPVAEAKSETFEPPKESKPQPVAEASPESISPKAKDLMEKMEEVTKSAVPDWCQQYSFSDLDGLKNDLGNLNEQVRQTQTKIQEIQKRITTLEWMKNALLALEGEDLHKACAQVLERLGWASKPAEANKEELWLQDGEWTVGIVRIVRTTSQVKRADLAQLAESVITFWGEHESEPKGILVASTWANRPPSERNEPDYTEALSDFAEKKHLCLMTTGQLLCIYRDMESGQASPDELREKILSTSGTLAGFALEPGLAKARV